MSTNSFPMISAFSTLNSFSDSGFICRAAICASVDTTWMKCLPWSRCSLKCHYLLFIYLVRGLILGMVAIVNGAMLSLKTLQCTLVLLLRVHTLLSAFSSIKHINCMAVLSPLLIAIIFASVVLSATSVCILEAHVTANPASLTINHSRIGC